MWVLEMGCILYAYSLDYRAVNLKYQLFICKIISLGLLEFVIPIHADYFQQCLSQTNASHVSWISLEFITNVAESRLALLAAAPQII